MRRAGRSLVAVGALVLLGWSGEAFGGEASDAGQDAGNAHAASAPKVERSPASGVERAPVAERDPAAGRTPRPAAERVPRAQRDPPTRWYGWQTLASDAAWFSLALAAGADDDEVAGAVLGIYLLGPPLIHLGHGQVWESATSFGLRAVPAPWFLPSVNAHCFSSDDRGRWEPRSKWCVLLSFGVFVIPLAIVVDAAVLSHEEVEHEPASVSYSLAPWIDPERESGGAALVGRF